MSKWKAIVLIVGMLVSFGGVASAATLTAEWTPQTTMSATVDGTRIYQDTSTGGPVASSIGVVNNSVSFPMPVDGKCHNYWATNYKGTTESPKSDVITWCPVNTDPPPAIGPPVNVGGFKITTTVTPLN